MDKTRRSLVKADTLIEEIPIVNGLCPKCGGSITAMMSGNKCYFCGEPIEWELLQEEK